jgi:uncharacterized protein (DUF58 family)
MLGNFPMEGNVSGIHKSTHKGSSVEFAEYREYTPGEDPRRIDWRVLARTDKYFLKEFEAETNLRAHHILDCSGSMTFGQPVNKFEFGKRIISTLSYLYLHQGDAVGLNLIKAKGMVDLPSRRNPSQLQNILQTLGKSNASGEDFLVTQLHQAADSIKSRALVMMFSDFLVDPKSLANAIHHMRYRKHEVVLFHLLDQQEIDFQFDRPTRFIDLEGGISVLTEPTVIRNEYISQMENHVTAIRKICTETQSSHHLTITDLGITNALKAFSSDRSSM